MFKALTRGSVRLVERYLPDPYIFVILLTLIAGIAAMAIEQRTPMDIVRYWGNGFWGLLTFAMQRLLVLLTGHMLASTPLVKRWLRGLASLARSAGSAIMLDLGLAATLSEWMVSFATATTLPFWTFMSAGLVNIFVPSGGGQWAVQSPVVIAAAQALDADMARTAMAVAWGDS